MATEKIEIEIIAKGKPAEKAIKGVETKTKDLGKTSKKTGKDTDGMLTKMKAGWIAVGAAMALSVNKAATFERASIGLTQAQKDWAKETALATDIQAEQVAGFLKSAKTAGLSEDSMKALAKQAIALGYAFPHEDAETLHDNLVMLNSTGEAQGFVVDILEQQYAKMGVQFDNIDLKAVSLEEKLKLVNNVVAESQSQMDSSTFKEYQETLGAMDNAASSLGDTIVTLATESGALGLFNKMLGASDLLLKRLHLGVLGLSGIFNETNEERARWLELGISVLEQDEKLYGSDNKKKIFEYKKELMGINEELGKIKKNKLTVDIIGGTDTSNFLSDLKFKIQEMGVDLESFGAGWREATGTVKSSAEQWKSAGKSAANAIGDYLTNMVMGAKTSFSDLTKFIVAQLLKMAIMQRVVTPLGSFFGLSSHTGTSEVKHTGGAIGRASVPSFHNGLKSDERMAKLQVGEAVVNRMGASRNPQVIDAMNAGMPIGGGGNVTQAEINFNVQAIDAASFNNYLVGNKHVIEGIINRSLQTNGTVRQTIKQVV